MARSAFIGCSFLVFLSFRQKPRKIFLLRGLTAPVKKPELKNLPHRDVAREGSLRPTVVSLPLTSALCRGGLHCMLADTSIVSSSTRMSPAEAPLPPGCVEVEIAVVDDVEDNVAFPRSPVSSCPWRNNAQKTEGGRTEPSKSKEKKIKHDRT